MASLRGMLRPVLGVTSMAVLAATVSMPALAEKGDLTLIHLSDLHGNIAPHAGVFHNPDGSKRYATHAGGVAKIQTLINEIRADAPNSLLLAVGDSTHGTAEVLFTVGDAIMPAMNAMGIDAYTPGNWEFGYGPAVFRGRFTAADPLALPANIRIMSDAYDGDGVTKATFPSLAANLYNAHSDPIPSGGQGLPVLPAYQMFDKDGITVGVIGITAAIVPQQPDVFNIGFEFTQGVEELPGLIDAVKAEGADLIVVQSELGLSQNIEIAREFEDIDVVLSAHTHEVTLGALLVNEEEVVATTPGAALSGHEQSMLADGAAVVVESTEDLYLGRLDLKVSGDKLSDFTWTAIPVDDDVAEDPDMKAIADAAEAPFVDGPDFVRHTFMPGGYCPGGDCGDITQRGLQLTDGLDTVVGQTEVLLHRDNVLEDVVNNFIADAIRSVTDPIVAAQTDWDGVDISMTNGFRFGNPVLSPNEGGSGDITLRDLYTLFPISPAVAVAEFSGQSIERSLEEILAAVFDPNPYRQRGGWYVGMANMTQKLDLVNRPFSSSGGRIVETTVGDAPLDPSKRYVFASCFPHGDPLDRICRTGGGTGHLFFQLADPNDFNSDITLVPPKNTENIISFIDNPNDPTKRIAVVKQIAPDTYLHPVHVLRRFLQANGPITESQFAVGRIKTVDSTVAGWPEVPAPVSDIDPTLIQPPEGAGPDFFGIRVGDDD